jgi:hypothetical protein
MVFSLWFIVLKGGDATKIQAIPNCRTIDHKLKTINY